MLTGTLVSGPFFVAMVWLTLRGSNYGFLFLLIGIVLAAPFGALVAAGEQGLSPEEAFADGVRRAKNLARDEWSAGWRNRFLLVAEVPLGLLAISWFGLGVWVLKPRFRHDG